MLCVMEQQGVNAYVLEALASTLVLALALAVALVLALAPALALRCWRVMGEWRGALGEKPLCVIVARQKGS